MTTKTYSAFSDAVWPAFKKSFKKRDEHNFCAFAHKSIQNALTLDLDIRKAGFMLLESHLMFLWKFRKIDHYFLESGVANFCESSIKEFDEDHCKRFPPCSLVNAPQGTQFMYTLGNHAVGGFAVHFPASEHRRSIMAIPQYIQPSFRPVSFAEDIEDIFYIAASDGKWSIIMQKNEDLSSFKDANNIGRLLFGLSLYMDAFPDAIIESKEGDIHKIGHYHGSQNIVSRNKIVNEESLHGVSPHWRRGHFRLLQSERFVRKHWQTVYVRGTFVKGQAFDVLDDAPPIIQPTAATAPSVPAQ